MRVFNHPVYKQVKAFCNTKGLRTYRRQLRKADAILIAEYKSRKITVHEDVRMNIVLISELAAQKLRGNLYSSQLEVKIDPEDANRINVMLSSSFLESINLTGMKVDQ